ncbi:MAG: hypothetical protein QXH90_07440 [Candidatus Korarchaeum sp.]
MSISGFGSLASPSGVENILSILSGRKKKLLKAEQKVSMGGLGSCPYAQEVYGRFGSLLPD